MERPTRIRPTTGAHPRRRRRTARRRHLSGLLLMVLALGALLGALTPALAQESDDDTEPVEVDRHQVYVSPLTDAAPAALTSRFPPEVVCIVFPDTCGDEAQQANEAFQTATGEVDDNAPTSPVQPVPPDSVAASFAAGTTRYQSALRFELPEVPSGEEIVTYRLTIEQGQPTYHSSSPMFRQAVLAAVAGVGSQDEQVFRDEFVKALEREPVDQQVIGIEACPLTQAFEGTEAGEARSDDEIPREEGDDDGPGPLALNCILGANGQFDEDAGTWSFDLTFAAEDWSSGELDNHGVLLRPAAAPNLAFGDPDTSTNAQVVLDVTTASATVETAPPPEPVEPLEPLSTDGGAGGVDDGGGGEAPAPEVSFGEPVDTGGGVETGGGTGLGTGQPDVAPAEPAPETDAPAVAAPDTEPAASVPQTPWWVWTLVPVFLGGMYVMAQALVADPALATGARGGAMTRLIAQRRAAATPSPMTQV